MDKSLFTDKAIGKLVKIHVHGQEDWAFIPAPLPENWRIPDSIWPLLMQAREEMARLDGIGRHMPNYELLLKPLQHREALKSSSLEGTYATPEQLLLFEIDQRQPKSQRDPVNAWREVLNYNDALRLGQKLLNDIPVSLRLIKELHRELLSGVRGHERSPGNFRKSQVHIGSDRRFIPPPFQEALKCLNELEKYIHGTRDMDPLVFCFMVHYQFETIHPFLDGNGRVGRLLLSLMIYKWCKLTNPWLYLSAFFDRYKDEYIQNLFDVSTKGTWEKWITYCLRATINQAKDAVRRFDRLVNLKEKYQQSVTDHGGNIRLHRIIDKLFEVPIITIPQTKELLKVSYPTARNDIQKLISSDMLVTASEIDKLPKVFVAPEIMEAAYSDFQDDDEL